MSADKCLPGRCARRPGRLGSLARPVLFSRHVFASGFRFASGSASRRPFFVPARRAMLPPAGLHKKRGQMMSAWQMWPRPEGHRVADGQIPPFLSGLLLRTGVDPVLFACDSEAKPRGCLLLACATNEDE